MAYQRVSRVLLAEQYTGANGADVLAMCQMITQYSGNTWTLASDDGKTLVLCETSPRGLVGSWPILAGQWCVVAPDTGIIARISDAVYQVRYKALSSIVSDAVAANLEAITAGVRFGGFGVAALPALLLPGATSSPIDVEVKPTQPSTGYAVEAFGVSGAAVLTTLTVVSVTKVAETAPPAMVGRSKKVQVVVRNNGLVSLSGLLLVHITPPMPADVVTAK